MCNTVIDKMLPNAVFDNIYPNLSRRNTIFRNSINLILRLLIIAKVRTTVLLLFIAFFQSRILHWSVGQLIMLLGIDVMHFRHSPVPAIMLNKVKASHTLLSVGPGADPSVQAVSPQVTISYPPGGRLPLLSARPAVTFPAAEHHCPLAGTKLYYLVTEAHRCEQLAQGCYAAAPSRSWTHDQMIAIPTLYPLRHHATYSALM